MGKITMSQGKEEANLEREFEKYAALARAASQAKLTEKKVASELIQAITAGKNAIDGLRLLSQYANEVKDIQKRGEFMRIIGELSLELAETQIKLAEHVRENDSLKEKISHLEKEIDKLSNPTLELIHKNGLYYTPEGDGPFCTICYDSKKQKIRLPEMPAVMQALGKYKCGICNTTYS
jgi:cell division protein FtsB